MCEDISLAERYVAKAKSSRDRGIEFNLTFSEYKRLSKIKRCQYTGIVFSEYHNGSPKNENTMRTLERIDNSKGYIKGNVVAVCKSINGIKSMWENPSNPITMDLVLKTITRINKHLNE